MPQVRDNGGAFFLRFIYIISAIHVISQHPSFHCVAATNRPQSLPCSSFQSADMPLQIPSARAQLFRFC